MTPDAIHDLFLASAGVAGALIGLLFVAISVDPDRVVSDSADQVHRVRARAALTAFTNALTVSLFALTPDSLGVTSFCVGIVGILFVVASVLSVRRMKRVEQSRTGRLRDLTFLIAQFVVFALEVFNGLRLMRHPHTVDPAADIARLVITSFLIGIYRSWELIRGPGFGIRGEVRELVREVHNHEPRERESAAGE